MRKKIKVSRDYNEEFGEIIKSLEITETKDEYNPEECIFKTTFYYEVSKESGIFHDNIGYCNISWSHANPVNYDNYHKNIVPLDWALSAMGYNMLEDEVSWRKKLREDDDFATELTTKIQYLRPISKEEYYSNLKEV